ncbi:CMRF35-like molecule 7 [Cyprinus carpio]|uniref:CMRF35-like molecule 7 n=1 Tax=Cyprinus carpio TaxID=7962 RepID=A0A9Q9ZS66_CYPCA|nr:CMRF35-like molecule 7 [Cyprinus carpio]
MKIIWTFTLLMIPGVLSSISVTGYSGRGVSITCRYDRRYTDNKKYFCKGQWSKCTDQIRTNTKNKQVDSGRFSLYDDTRAAVFTVTIRDLREQDSDIYYCGTDIYAKVDSYTEVKLKVVTAADCCEKSISLSAAAGGSVNISCRYPQSHSAHVKFCLQEIWNLISVLKRPEYWCGVQSDQGHKSFITRVLINVTGQY